MRSLALFIASVMHIWLSCSLFRISCRWLAGISIYCLQIISSFYAVSSSPQLLYYHKSLDTFFLFFDYPWYMYCKTCYRIGFFSVCCLTSCSVQSRIFILSLALICSVSYSHIDHQARSQDTQTVLFGIIRHLILT